ncbi:chemotaxis protein CheA [Pyxidicoccus xibeiensis]|uniref:chemotaxis protein CheA n=1 Tax=Pyxidicoccus xibeiensis TaxID=2906759 RepID=UPI0020A80EB3|nr:chemotaxis protein CheW [Pyxidicoccus xibeiensis]MCP3139082.1 chemotaxis protein CheA [Pyxidicoccus xibeiensis]
MHIFVEEADGLLRCLEQGFLALEAYPSARDVLPGMLRAAHTLKGSSASLGLERLPAFTHSLEESLEALRDGRLVADAALVSGLLRAVDGLRHMARNTRLGEPEETGDMERILAELDLLRGRTGLPPAGPASEPLPHPHAGDDAPVPAAAVRVEEERLDRLLDVTGELSLGHGRLMEHVRGGASRETLLSGLEDLGQRLRSLEAAVLQARLVPVESVLQDPQRTVRDAAEACGKRVRLRIDATGADVDTRVIRPLRSALVHLLRNAVDHGIEAPQTRAERGKPAEGTLTLSAGHQRGFLVVTLSDDGGGLDRGRILARARERGLVAPDARPSDEELDALIFAPGFSTAEAVTALSGRGVGLDAVRQEVESVRGALSVSSQEGQGTTFTLRLPLHLAIVPGFAVSVGAAAYLVPLEAVEECGPLPPGITRAEAARGVVDLGARVVPFLRLRAAFPSGGMPSHREEFVVVRTDAGRVALVVDALLGERHVVLKPLGPLLRRQPGLAGASVLPDGRLALLLDLPSLLRSSLSIPSSSAVPAPRGTR